MRSSRRKKHNLGYSFVELVIVIGIMGVLAGLAVVTWRSVDSANYRKSVAVFEEELRTLRTSTMGQSGMLAMKVYYEPVSDKYYIARGVVTESGFTETIDTATYPELANAPYLNYEGVSNPVLVGKKLSIMHGGSKIDDSGLVIQFNKSDGSISDANGAGEYVFYRKNGDEIAKVKIQKNTGSFVKSFY